MALKSRCSSAEERLETMHDLETEVKTLREKHTEWTIEREDREHRIRDLHLKLAIAEKKATESEADDRERRESLESKLGQVKKLDQTLAANDEKWQAKLARNDARCNHPAAQ